MATSLKLFYTYANTTSKWLLNPEKLLIVDDVEDYLALQSYYSIADFQYIKNQLELGINVDISQSYSQPKSDTNFKYVAIQNAGEKVHYYFVKNAIWRSKSCVRFELVMDVLNTFKENSDYVWKANTKITREHKDRFSLKGRTITIEYYLISESGEGVGEDDIVNLQTRDLGNLILTGKVLEVEQYGIRIKITSDETDEEIANGINNADDDFEIVVVDSPLDFYLVSISPNSFSIYNQWFRNIDAISETILPPLKQESRSKLENNKSLLRQNWYLLYRNANEPDPSDLVNPVECYLIPENETQTNAAYITGGRLIPSWLQNDRWYFFDLEYGLKITLSNGVSFTGGIYKNIVEITKAGNKMTVTIWRVLSNFAVIGFYDEIDYVTFDSVPVNYNYTDTFQEIKEDYLDNMSFPYSFTNSDNPISIDAITNLDRTDARNIKLIKLPYCPYDFSISSSRLVVDGNTTWEVATFNQTLRGDMTALKLINENYKLNSTINQNDSPLADLQISFPDNADIDNLRITSVETESKMFHSDFYRPTYVYDSFSITLDMEKLNIDSYVDISSTLHIKFDMTSTINSKFMFTLKDYYCNKANQNFYNVLPIARNNEEVLYNSPYINYVRTGFNYDIKSKNIQNVSNGVGLGLSAASLGVALALPSAPLKVAGVVGSLVSLAMSIKTTITTAISSENSIREKLLTKQNEAIAVAGSDDVDLMSVYSENRLWYMVYTPNDIMKHLLRELFFYAGYNSGRMGIPNHNTRLNFDYLECDASFEKLASIPQDCLTELINCFKNGVTYIHKTSRTSNKWDFEQKYENWEKWLFD